MTLIHIHKLELVLQAREDLEPLEACALRHPLGELRVVDVVVPALVKALEIRLDNLEGAVEELPRLALGTLEVSLLLLLELFLGHADGRRVLARHARAGHLGGAHVEHVHEAREGDLLALLARVLDDRDRRLLPHLELAAYELFQLVSVELPALVQVVLGPVGLHRDEGVGHDLAVDVVLEEVLVRADIRPQEEQAEEFGKIEVAVPGGVHALPDVLEVFFIVEARQCQLLLQRLPHQHPCAVAVQPLEPGLDDSEGLLEQLLKRVIGGIGGVVVLLCVLWPAREDHVGR
mmetsp:Transcript_67940/g.167778  ORF Transcript_67940/g.167778 Transcript_67940/m.167778 type:complete len:290 (+) Transcript_67940:1360-2229(+)